MPTRIELSIAGRGEADAPLLGDLIEQIRDFFEMVDGVAASLAGDDVTRYDWQVVALSKNSPATVVVEAVPRRGFPEAGQIAAHARDLTATGMLELQRDGSRPLHFDDNVIEAAGRFAQRITRGLSLTAVTDGYSKLLEVAGPAAIEVVGNIERVMEADPVHPYREIGSFEGRVLNAGKDGYGRPFILVKSRLDGRDVKCFLTGDAKNEFGRAEVDNAVWRQRHVTAIGILRYRSPGRLSQAEISELVFSDPDEHLPDLEDIIDRDFTGGLSSEEYLEKVRDGDAA